MIYGKDSRKGIYKPVNPQKYQGNVDNIVFRSLWELRVMQWLDKNKNVIRWSSEEHIIPYLSPLDKRIHRYFPDFWTELRTKDGKVDTYLLEIKPMKMTKEPVKKNRINRTYVNEVVNYGINQAKFAAADEYCKTKGWKFKVLTEKEIYGSKEEY